MQSVDKKGRGGKVAERERGRKEVEDQRLEVPGGQLAFPSGLLQECPRISAVQQDKRKGAFLFFFFAFLGLYPWHMEVPQLGVQSEL